MNLAYDCFFVSSKNKISINSYRTRKQFLFSFNLRQGLSQNLNLSPPNIKLGCIVKFSCRRKLIHGMKTCFIVFTSSAKINHVVGISLSSIETSIFVSDLSDIKYSPRISGSFQTIVNDSQPSKSRLFLSAS